MRIAIDARELTGRPTGVGRYLSELLSSWGRLPGAAAHDFVLCASEPVQRDGDNGLRISTEIARGHGTLWQQLALPRLVKAARADVLFAPAYTGPLATRIPTVLAVHDVSFVAHPEWFRWREGLRRRFVTRISARRAARIVTFSDFSKREIVRRLGIDHSKIEVIYHGATTLGAAQGPDLSRTRDQGPRTQNQEGAGHDSIPGNNDPLLVLYVGSIFNRRHIPELVDGFSRVAGRHPSLRLELVGENRTTPHLDIDAIIRGSTAREQIRAGSYVSDAHLAALYRSASVFVFLSDYEGFGMTPLEALAAGVPIIVLDTEVAREIYGPAALYIERPEPQLIEAALERLLFDREERARQLAAAAIVLPRYSWQECAQRTLQVLLASASG